MGHLTRQLAILRWVRRYAEVLGEKVECWLLTSSEADTLARREGVPALKIPSKAMLRDAGLEPHRLLAVARGWVLSAVTTLQPDVLVVDTFPAGSFGELVSVLELVRHRVLVAREVRPELAEDPTWKALLPLYHRVIVPGEGWGDPPGPILLRERAELWTRARARAALGIPAGARACWLSVGGGGDGQAGNLLPRLVDGVRARGWHPVVAAGPLYSGEERRGPDVTWLERYAAAELLPGVDAAITAAGYNATWELALAGVPAVFLPRPRLADDQAARAERVVARGFGLLAPDVDAAPGLLDALRPPPDDPLPTGARAAAATVLSLALDPRDVAAAAAAWSDDALAALRGVDLPDARVLDLFRLFGGDRPSELTRRDAAVADLSARGARWVAAPAAGFLTLCAELPAPPVEVLPLAQRLRQLFPASDPPALLAACRTLLPALAPWADWTGALSVLRALPVQREWTVPRFAERLAVWARAHEDPYDLLRALNAGLARRVPLAELLAEAP